MLNKHSIGVITCLTKKYWWMDSLTILKEPATVKTSNQFVWTATFTNIETKKKP